ncbi:hypothetical protein Xedl_03912 [Xenorhabdus eapokensis]|uniref:Uncharacterized protein n=1 Tax=Xenorhabdus eapokensis TaxID=1873482 RepID=A0A1Q5TBX3_9GAMM|nr:hypothetical protein Xedl_03912 [Xenorhabdus eapokensis]
MQCQPLTAFRIFKQQLVIPFALVGLGAEGHLGFTARQPARWNVAGVVGTPGNDRLIRVAVQKIHHHFLADTRDRQHAPALPRPRLGDAYPAGTLVIALAVAIPRELEANSPVLITENLFAGRPHHFGDLRAVNHGFWQRRRAPVLVMADKVELAVQAGARAAVGGFQRLGLAAGMAGAHDLPGLIQIFPRVVVQGE